MFALAYVFFLRSPSQQPVPQARAIHGEAAWTYEDVAGHRVTERVPFAAVAGPDFVRQAAARRARPATSGVQRDSATGVSPLDYAGLAAVVRSAAADHDHGVGIKPVEQNGRRLWRAAITFTRSLVELAVDQKSGIVQWCVIQDKNADGLPREQFEVKRIDYSAPPAAQTVVAASALATAATSPAAGAQDGGTSPAATPGSPSPAESGRLIVPEKSGGVRYYRSMSAAAAAAGFTPLVSDLAPDGYRLAAAGVADDGLLGDVQAAAAKQARRLDLLYVRGLSAFRVSELAVSEGVAQRLASAVPGESALAYQSTPVQYGSFAGGEAETWFSPEGPALLLVSGGYVVLVRGELTRQELVDLAEGFRKAE